MVEHTPAGDRVERAKQFTDAQLAFHEAGHAVAHVRRGGTIDHVSIERENPARGTHAVALPAAERGRTQALDDARRRIEVLMAGEVALGLRSGERVDVRDSGDRAAAVAAARGAGATAGEAQTLLDEARERVRAELQAPATWAQIEAVANALQQRRRLAGDEVQLLVSEAGR